jgi:hypothetical protein
MSGVPHFVLAKEVLSQTLGDQTVLMHISSGEYFELNVSGSVVLSSLLRGDEQSAAQALLERFAVSDAQARSDVGALIGVLRERGLLQLT